MPGGGAGGAETLVRRCKGRNRGKAKDWERRYKGEGNTYKGKNEREI